MSYPDSDIKKKDVYIDSFIRDFLCPCKKMEQKMQRL